MKKIPLHWQIVIGLVLGALFGGLFPVSKTGIDVVLYKQTVEIADWQLATLQYDTLTATFRAGERDALFKSMASLKLPVRKAAKLTFVMPSGAQQQFTEILRLVKPTSIASEIRPVGTLFLNLLKMIAIPLVLASLIVGASSLGDVRQMARIGGKTIGLYICTTALAITLGLVVANVLQPGHHMPAGASERLMAEFSGNIADKVSQELDFSVLDFLLNIVPTNPFAAIAGGDMLHIVFFAVFLGLILSVIPKPKSEPVIRFFDGLSEASIRMVEVVMLAAPLGVFALMAVTIADFGFEILMTLIWYVAAVVLGLFLHIAVVYTPLLAILGKTKFSTFARGIRRAQLLGFSTSSSAATLPVTMECVEEMGVSSKISSFVLPLGTTINMDGTALYQGIAAVFIAQVYGIPLDLGAQVTIVLTATLASIGTAPVPGVGIIMLIIVLRSVGIPEEGIALILGVDRILDMLRTVVNVTGDAVVTVVVASGENAIGQPHLTDDGVNYPLTKK